MRTKIFRSLALTIGVLGVPAVAWDAWKHWPLPEARAWLLVGEIIVLWAFLMFGTRSDRGLTIELDPDVKPIVVPRREHEQRNEGKRG